MSLLYSIITDYQLTIVSARYVLCMFANTNWMAIAVHNVLSLASDSDHETYVECICTPSPSGRRGVKASCSVREGSVFSVDRIKQLKHRMHAYNALSVLWKWNWTCKTPQYIPQLISDQSCISTLWKTSYNYAQDMSSITVLLLSLIIHLRSILEPRSMLWHYWRFFCQLWLLSLRGFCKQSMHLNTNPPHST